MYFPVMYWRIWRRTSARDMLVVSNYLTYMILCSLAALALGFPRGMHRGRVQLRCCGGEVTHVGLNIINQIYSTFLTRLGQV